MELVSPERPLALYVDPAFDLFRALDPREIPPSIGQIFGEQRVLAVVAATATPDQAIAYAQMIEAWASEHQQPEIVTDGDVDALPADRGVWLLGRDNRFARELFGARAELEIGASSVSIHDQQLAWADHTLVAVTRHPGATDRAIGWIAADPVAALVGLARKLPHYGKYSYLGFAGSEPTNVLKGQWSGADSPLTIDLRPEAERNAPLAPLTIEPEPALVPGTTAKASGARPGAARPSS